MKAEDGPARGERMRPQPSVGMDGNGVACSREQRDIAARIAVRGRPRELDGPNLVAEAAQLAGPMTERSLERAREPPVAHRRPCPHAAVNPEHGTDRRDQLLRARREQHAEVACLEVLIEQPSRARIGGRRHLRRGEIRELEQGFVGQTTSRGQRGVPHPGEIGVGDAVSREPRRGSRAGRRRSSPAAGGA
jgi:hypothetical protein